MFCRPFKTYLCLKELQVIMDNYSKIKSPCDNNCIIDIYLNICQGCYRTMDEIIRWATMNEREKAAVLKNIDLRKKNYLK
jgi:hypothetical protein